MSKSESLQSPREANLKQTPNAGFAWMIGAKAFFIVASYSIALLLPRWLGSVAEFGLFASALTLISLVNNILTVSTIQSVSHFTGLSTGERVSNEAPEARYRQGLKVQFWVGALLFGSFVALAKPISSFLNDDALVPLLQTMPALFFSYALYGAAAGYLNGKYRFSAQAKLDVLSSSFRALGILTPAFLGLGALGSARGLAISSLMVCAFAVVKTGLGISGEQIPWKKWFYFLVPMWVYYACINGALLSDLLVLKRTVSELALADGRTLVEASDQANELAGIYKGAQTFALVPYQFMLSITLVVFPAVSKISQMGDRETAKTVIQNALRFSLILLALIASPILAAPAELLGIVYPQSFVMGAPALGILVAGICFFGLFLVLASMLNSSGRPTLSALIAAGAWMICVFAVRSLVSVALQYSPSAEQELPIYWKMFWEFAMLFSTNDPFSASCRPLFATAVGTTLASIFAFSLAAFFVKRKFGVLFSVKTCARVLLSLMYAIFVVRLIPELPVLNGWVQLLLAPVAFALGLLVTREITKSELVTFRNQVKNKLSRNNGS